MMVFAGTPVPVTAEPLKIFPVGLTITTVSAVVPVEVPVALTWPMLKSASLAGAGSLIGELAAGISDSVVGIGVGVIAVSCSTSSITRLPNSVATALFVAGRRSAATQADRVPVDRAHTAARAASRCLPPAFHFHKATVRAGMGTAEFVGSRTDRRSAIRGSHSAATMQGRRSAPAATAHQRACTVGWVASSPGCASGDPLHQQTSARLAAHQVERSERQTDRANLPLRDC